PISPSTSTGNPPCGFGKCGFNYFIPSWRRRRHVSCARIPAEVRGTRPFAAPQLQHLFETYDRRHAVGTVQRSDTGRFLSAPWGITRRVAGSLLTADIRAVQLVHRFGYTLAGGSKIG